MCRGEVYLACVASAVSLSPEVDAYVGATYARTRVRSFVRWSLSRRLDASKPTAAAGPVAGRAEIRQLPGPLVSPATTRSEGATTMKQSRN